MRACAVNTCFFCGLVKSAISVRAKKSADLDDRRSFYISLI